MFINRIDAGRQLAEKLSIYKNRPDTIILALPRGGVPVAYEVAKKLNLPLDVFLVRKLGIPSHEETAMGAIAVGGIQILDEPLISRLNISKEAVQKIINKEQKELNYRNNLYRTNKRALKLSGKNIILIDDGIATGATMHAATKALKKQGVKEIIIAIPVSSESSYLTLSQEADKVVSLIVPPMFQAVGLYYQEFSQTSHEEVIKLLSKTNNTISINKFNTC